eukprot:1216560-Alexandrium_andersonii.AAC.1
MTAPYIFSPESVFSAAPPQEPPDRRLWRSGVVWSGDWPPWRGRACHERPASMHTRTFLTAILR